MHVRETGAKRSRANRLVCTVSEIYYIKNFVGGSLRRPCVKPVEAGVEALSSKRPIRVRVRITIKDP